MAMTIALALPLAVSISGCANKNGPHARALPAGQTCTAVLKELRRMDAAGVPSSVEAVNAGRKVSAKRRQQAAHYNKVLDDYLGARCHTG